MRRNTFIVRIPLPGTPPSGRRFWKRGVPAATCRPRTSTWRSSPAQRGGRQHPQHRASARRFLAADEQAPVSMAHLLRVARAEYAKLGTVPLTDSEIGGLGLTWPTMHPIDRQRRRPSICDRGAGPARIRAGRRDG